MESSWSVLIGGFAFFFFGLSSAKKGLERIAGDRLRAAMSRMAGNRIIALFLGALVTLVLQSSGATSAILVSFTDIGLLSLFQSTAVLLGADIGTTFVVVMLSIKKITDVALIVVASGLLVKVIAKNRRTKNISRIVFGFGLVFYGMHLMSQAALPLKESDTAMKIFAYLAGHPLATLIMSAVISGAIHSAGTIGIAIALAFAGTLSFDAAVPIVLGANVGTCVTAVLAGLGSGTGGRRLALSHALSKIMGVTIVFLFMSYFIKSSIAIEHVIGIWFSNYSQGVAGEIAIVHILFNLFLAVLFLPLITPLVKLVKRLMPDSKNKSKEFGPKYLDRAALAMPAMAFANAKREVIRISSIAESMFEYLLRIFSRGVDNYDAIEHIEQEDDKIDVLEKSIRFYLAEISTDGMEDAHVRRQMALLTIAADLEDVGDTMSHEMAMLARKKAKRNIFFSDDGWRDLRHFQAMVMENVKLTSALLSQPDEEIARRIVRHERHMNDVEQQLRQSHISRLHEGLKESFDTSSIHLDILTNIRRINSKLAHIADATSALR